MAVTFNTSGNAAGLWTTYILRKFVPALRANTILTQYAEPATLPKGEGALVARWNRMSNLTVDTTALTEASATDNQITEITVTAVTATISSYGQWMSISDLAEESVTRSTLDGYADTFAYAGSQTVDALIRNAADDTTSFLHAGDTALSGVTLTSGDTLTAQDAVVAGELLRKNYARGFDNLNGRYFFGIAPEAEQDMVTDVTTTRLSWSNVFQHTSPGLDKIVNKTNGDVVGAIGRVVVGLSDVIDTVTEDVAAYKNLALARYGVGWLGFGSGKPMPKVIMKRPGPQDTSNPLNQFMTIGWKVKTAQALLDSSRVIVVYSAV